MPLINCSEQKRQTLEEFYKGLIPNYVDTFVDIGTPMLNVLRLINETFKETIINGLTSHARLLLLNKDSSLSPWYIVLNGLKTTPGALGIEYNIEYLMTADKQHWSHARIKGEKSLLSI